METCELGPEPCQTNATQPRSSLQPSPLGLLPAPPAFSVVPGPVPRIEAIINLILPIRFPLWPFSLHHFE